MSDSELRELNEKLKRGILTAAEWANVDAHVAAKSSDYVTNEMSVKFPMLAMKYRRSKHGYFLFLQIVATELNNNPIFIAKNLTASACKEEHGDGSGCCLKIEKDGRTITCASVMEEYGNFTQENGARVLGEFVEQIANHFRMFR